MDTALKEKYFERWETRGIIYCHLCKVFDQTADKERERQNPLKGITSFHPETPDAETFGFRIGKWLFFVLARRSRCFAETYIVYVAQAIPQFNTARAEKSPFRTETNYNSGVISYQIRI